MTFEPALFYWQLMVSALTVLCFFSSIIGYNTKERSFGFYGIYTFFLLSYFILITPYDVDWRDALFQTPFKSLQWYIQVIYNCAYFLFFIYFLDIKQHLDKFYRFIIKVLSILFIAATAVFIYAMAFSVPSVFDQFYIYIFVPILFVFAVYGLYRSLAIPGKLKYFFIIGGGTFICFAMMALFLPLMGLTFFKVKPYTLFYIGIFIEQTAFVIGLAYKIKLINRAFLHKSIENQKIKEKQNQVLTDELEKNKQMLTDISAKAEEERVARLKAKFENQIHHLQLISLQNQMNPHFIFNALNSIKALLIDDKAEKAVYFLNKFSKLLRIILESSKGESINLSEEINILKLYVNIENIRFEEKVHLSIQNPEKIKLNKISIPPMLLQAFIEKAIWQGLSLKENERHISIAFSKQGSKTLMTIVDNGKDREKTQNTNKKDSSQKDSLSLTIVRDRLKYFNRKKNLHYRFSIENDLEDGEVKGTRVNFIFE